VTGADQASVTNNNRKAGGGKSKHGKTAIIAMAAPCKQNGSTLLLMMKLTLLTGAF
jgi:hypothetical protein